MASRAHLLSGLRTGGPAYDSDSSRSSSRLSENNKGLKADAAPFTPGNARMAQSANEVPNDLASMHGGLQSQAQQQQQESMANMIRQRQAQMMQQQLLAQQQQQQMEMYRLHAASQQQHHLQEVAAKQRLLLAQMQAEYSMQQQEQAMSAQDQRMAAQATIQASLRQRQAEQVYAQLFQQQEVNEAQAQQQQLLQQLQLLQLQAATVQSMQEQQGYSEEYHPRRNGATNRSDSPNNAQQQQNRRDRQASYAAAENATSWRSTSLALPKPSSSGRKTPSIVVDDSASEKSNASHRSDSETPETSEEDIVVSGETRKSPTLNSERRLPSSLPRPLALSAAPRSRNFSIESKMITPSANGTAHGNNATRQPRGPPTEFIAINFTTRMSARTRREAMSKLCASPRAASFATSSRPTVVA